MNERNLRKSDKGLQGSGIKVLAGSFLGPFILAVILFAAAGRVDVPRAWIYIAVSLIFIPSGPVLLWKHNVELLNERGKWRKKRDTKSWDKVLVPAYGLVGFYVIPVVIGLDVGRYEWSNLSVHFAAAGLVLYAGGTVLIDWALMVNPYFETTVRIQTDRGHRVITTGPYRFVRHPGYIAAILWVISPPLIVGSLFGLVPAAIAALLLIIRTWLEDEALCQELNGYREYAEKIRYKLVPGIW